MQAASLHSELCSTGRAGRPRPRVSPFSDWSAYLFSHGELGTSVLHSNAGWQPAGRAVVPDRVSDLFRMVRIPVFPMANWERQCFIPMQAGSLQVARSSPTACQTFPTGPYTCFPMANWECLCFIPMQAGSLRYVFNDPLLTVTFLSATIIAHE